MFYVFFKLNVYRINVSIQQEYYKQKSNLNCRNIVKFEWNDLHLEAQL